MSTRCLIGKENKDKTITYSYCHNDGYKTYVGNLLKDYYNNEDRIDALLTKGDMSVLGKKIEDEDIDISKENLDGPKYDLCCIFYAPEEELHTGHANNIEEFINTHSWQEYEYLFKDGKWYYRSHGPYPDNTNEFEIL